MGKKPCRKRFTHKKRHLKQLVPCGEIEAHQSPEQSSEPHSEAPLSSSVGTIELSTGDKCENDHSVAECQCSAESTEEAISSCGEPIGTCHESEVKVNRRSDHSHNTTEEKCGAVPPVVSVPELVVSHELLAEVKDKVQLFLNKRFVPIITHHALHVAQISIHSNLSIQRTFVFHPTGKVDLYVHCHPVSIDPFLNSVNPPQPLESNVHSIDYFVDRCVKIINRVRDMEICSGNDNAKFKEVWSNCPFGEVDKNPYLECRYVETLRSLSCKLLVPSRLWRCSECSKLSAPLRRRLAAELKDPHPHTPNIFLSESQKMEKLEEQRRKLNNASRKLTHLQQRMQELLKKKGVNIDVHLSEDLNDILKNADLTPSQSIFRQQQVKASQLKNKCGMRWHPTMVRFALSIYLTSPAAYENARDTGIIKLPSKRTLFDYTHAKPLQDGIDLVALNSIALRVKDLPKAKCYHVLMADEMYISKNLVLQKSSGRLLGYTNLDAIDREVKSLEQFLDNSEAEFKETEANSVLVYMVKGISNGMKEVVATYAVCHPSTNQLYHWTWQVIGALERSKAYIIAMVSDGFSSNRAFIRMHTPVTTVPSGVIFDTINRAARERVLYFISDVPHLLKTLRNCLLNSRYDKQKGRRRMVKNGQKITWDYIIKLYEKFKGKSLRKSFKLSAMSIYPDSYGRMKVKYAAEVISNTVAQDLEDQKWDNTSELIYFLRMFNKWFDCLNGPHSSVGKKQRNENLNAYRKYILNPTSEDQRFKFLNEVLEYLDQWKVEANKSVVANSSIMSSISILSPVGEDESAVFQGCDDPSTETPTSKRTLSRETLEGIEMSTRAIMAAFTFLLKEDVDFINPRIFSQDPLEQHFSKVRGGLGGSTNPNLQQFLSKNRAIHLTGQMGMKRRRGNAPETEDWVEVTTEALPKRQCVRAAKFDC